MAKDTKFLLYDEDDADEDIALPPEHNFKKLLWIVLLIVFCSILFFVFFFSVKIQAFEDEEVQILFENFEQKYSKNYGPEERKFRFQIFARNFEELLKIQDENPDSDFFVTQFFDKTDDELRAFLGSNADERKEFEGIERTDPVFSMSFQRPGAVDWQAKGKVTPVKNQGQCGSCWSFATVASIESAQAIKKNSLVALSEQELIDCDKDNNGCNGGYRPYAYRFVKANGLVAESIYPYASYRHNTCALATKAPRVYIQNYEVLTNNEEAIANWVAANGPVSFGMHVTKGLFYYTSGIFNPSLRDCKEKSQGSHALTIVGYGQEGDRPYWLVKNSWGSSWGLSGYFKLARGVNACGMAQMVVAPVV